MKTRENKHNHCWRKNDNTCWKCGIIRKVRKPPERIFYSYIKDGIETKKLPDCVS